MTYVVRPVVARESQEIFQDMRELGKINQQLQKVGVVKEDCLSCIEEKSPDFQVSLDKSELDLGNPLFTQDDKPYVVYLKRTSNSPLKINLKFKNGYRYCEKTLIGSIAGGLAMGCLLYMTNYIDEEISLNFKNLPKLKDGEEEVVELRLTKPDTNNPKYNLKAASLTDAGVKGSVDKKFFGDGFNVNFTADGTGK